MLNVSTVTYTISVRNFLSAYPKMCQNEIRDYKMTTAPYLYLTKSPGMTIFINCAYGCKKNIMFNIKILACSKAEIKSSCSKT